MAAKSAKETKKEEKAKGEEESVKEISSSDLSAEELQQAINKQAEVADDGKKSSKPKASDEKPAKPASATTEEAKTGVGADGVPIIVRRRNNYINQQTQQKNPDTSEDEASDEPAKHHEQTVIKPPSATNMVVEAPKPDEASTKAQLEDSEATETPVSSAPPAEKTTQTQTETSPAIEPEKSDVVATASKQDENDNQAMGSVPVGAPQLSKSQSHPPLSNQPRQKPTVFDTTEYHLPIKVRNANYVNGAVAWVILLLALLVAGGYVMYRLGVFDLSQIGL